MGCKPRNVCVEFEGARQHSLLCRLGIEGDLLVSGHTDGMLRWWDARQEGRIHAGIQAHDGWVRSIKLWDIKSGRRLSTMRSNRPYERLTIAGVTGLTEAQKVTLRALGAVE